MLSYPVVIHQGGASTSDSRNVQDPQAVMAVSRERFNKKFGSIQAVRDAVHALDITRAPQQLVQWNTMLKTWVD